MFEKNKKRFKQETDKNHGTNEEENEVEEYDKLPPTNTLKRIRYDFSQYFIGSGSIYF